MSSVWDFSMFRTESQCVYCLRQCSQASLPERWGAHFGHVTLDIVRINSTIQQYIPQVINKRSKYFLLRLFEDCIKLVMMDWQLNDAFVSKRKLRFVKTPSGGILSSWSRNVDFRSMTYPGMTLRWGSPARSRPISMPALNFLANEKITICGHSRKKM